MERSLNKKKKVIKSNKHRLMQSGVKVDLDGGELGFTYVGNIKMGQAGDDF